VGRKRRGSGRLSTKRKLPAALKAETRPVEAETSGTESADPPVPPRSPEGQVTQTAASPDPLAERAAAERREVERRLNAEPCSCPSCKREDAEERDRRVFWY
jgi:hypothetical protein